MTRTPQRALQWVRGSSRVTAAGTRTAGNGGIQGRLQGGHSTTRPSASLLGAIEDARNLLTTRVSRLEICDYLNAEGHTTPGGAAWNPKNLSHWLNAWRTEGLL